MNTDDEPKFEFPEKPVAGVDYKRLSSRNPSFFQFEASRSGGLIVHAPRSARESQIQRVISENRSEIVALCEEAWNKNRGFSKALPEGIYLRALAAENSESGLLDMQSCFVPFRYQKRTLDSVRSDWATVIASLTCKQSATNKTVFEFDPSSVDERCVVYSGDYDDKDAFRYVTKRFLESIAREVLPTLVRERSEETGLRYGKVVIRSQKTKFGSYSTNKTISLNSRLMLLDRRFVDYVIDHELSHSVHFDHSSSFWSLLEKIHPNYRKDHEEIQHASSKLPTWAI